MNTYKCCTQIMEYTINAVLINQDIETLKTQTLVTNTLNLQTLGHTNTGIYRH